MAKDAKNSGTPDDQEEDLFEISPEVLKMAEGCFSSADEAARRSNFDYAIALYLEGLRYTPDNVERGHKPLYEVAKRRAMAGKAKGWTAKKSKMMANMLQMAGKKKDAFLELEKAMTGSPDNFMDLAALAVTSFSLKLEKTPVFFAQNAFELARRGGKLTEALCTQVADIYEARGMYRAAMDVLQEAEKLDKLGMGKHLKRIRDLAARTTIGAGLEDADSFRDRLKDEKSAKSSEKQRVLTAEDELVRKAEGLIEQLKQSPNDLNLMITIGDTYTRAGQDELATQYYRKARAASGGADYRIKVKMDDLRMRQFRQEVRALDDKLKASPKDEELRKQREELIKRRNEAELEIFGERAGEYPTDMRVRYELGLRNYRCGNIDEAIAAFQLATRDPKSKILSLNMLGKCFFTRKLHQEAAAQFRSAIEGYEFEGDAMWKELRYNLGLTYEAMGKIEDAVNCYSEIVMVDFQYRDAAKRLQELRKRLEGGGENGGMSPSTMD